MNVLALSLLIVAVSCSVLHCYWCVRPLTLHCCKVLQCVALLWMCQTSHSSLLQCVAVCCSALHCYWCVRPLTLHYCRALQCVTVWCSHNNVTHICGRPRTLAQGGKDSYDALSCWSFSAKEPLITGLFCGKWPAKMRHPMGLRHPVDLSLLKTEISVYHMYAWYHCDCNTLQNTATHCNTLQHTATHCNTLQHTATHCDALQRLRAVSFIRITLQHTATHRNTPQHTATHCSTLRHTATHCNALQHLSAVIFVLGMTL